MFAIGSPAQKRKGIQVGEDEIFKEKMAYANWRSIQPSPALPT